MNKETPFNDLRKRLCTSSIAILSLFLLLLFAYSPGVEYLLAIVVSGVVFFASWEWSNLSKGKEYALSKLGFSCLSALQVISFFIAYKAQIPLFPLFFLFLAVIYLFLDHFGKITNALPEIALSLFGLLYLSFPLGLIIILLYNFPQDSHQDGRWWIFYLIVVTKITDVAAYFVGRIFGKRKLAPQISPRKTVEGSIGGFVFALLMSILFALFSKEGVFLLPIKNAIFLGMILGIFSQIGDLCESLLKRDVKINDSSSVPGLGGFLDTLDSLLLNVPILFFYSKFFMR